MWYDKDRLEFHQYPNGQDPIQVVAKLRLLANSFEKGFQEPLTLNMLGDIFGNEFWNLVYYDLLNAVDRRVR